MRPVKAMIILFIGFAIQGCFSIKPATERSAGGLFETFYAGDKGTQYFIKPLSFRNRDKGKELNIDFTFRYKDTANDSVIINYSVLGEDIYRSMDSLKINSNNAQVVLENTDHMFSRKKRKDFESRFTTKEMLSNIKNLFDHDDWELILYKQDISINFETPRRTKRKIRELENNLFVLF